MKTFLIICSVLVGGMLLTPFGADKILQAQDFNYTRQLKPRLTKNYELLQRAGELGIDVSALNIYIDDGMQADDLADADSVFAPPNTIVIHNGFTPAEQRELLAHEYLHYVWSKSKPSEAVIEANNAAAINDPFLRQQLSQYTNCDRLCIADEVNSYACTAEPPQYLDATYNQYCNSLIPNRVILF